MPNAVLGAGPYNETGCGLDVVRATKEANTLIAPMGWQRGSLTPNHVLGLILPAI